MSINQELEPVPQLHDLRALNWAKRLDRVGSAVLRYGLVALLLLFGSMKFTAFEAEGIRPLIEHSPLLSWLYPVLGIQGASALIGVVELSAALLIGARHWQPAWAAIGSLLAVGTFLVTLSFLFTTPGILEPTNPFGGFIMKDVILLAAALWSSGEALRARAAARTAAAVSDRSAR